MAIADDLVDEAHLHPWLEESGAALGLVIGPKGLPACWAQHPVSRHEVTGLFLAWSALARAFAPDELEAFSAAPPPGPRDFLDLSNASAAAIARAIHDGATFARAGHHVGERPA